VRLVGEPRGRQGADDGDVAQPAAGLLEVGLDALGEVVEAGVPGGERLEQGRQAGARGLAPVVVEGGPHRGAHLGVPGDVGEVEQPDGRREITGGDVAALREGAHAVVDADPAVPQRIQQPVG